MKTDQTYAQYQLGQKASALSSLAKQAFIEYREGCRTQYLTLAPLNIALSEAAKAAEALLGLLGKTTIVPTEGLYAPAVDAIGAVELIVAGIDINKAKTNAIYAGSLKGQADVALASGQAALAFVAAVENLLKATETCNQAKAARDALNNPTS